MAFHAVVILHAKPGKADRIVELLKDVAVYVKEKEPGVARYHIHKELKPSKDGVQDVVMLETYKDKATMIEHGSSEKFKVFQKAGAKEDLFRAPPTMKFVGEEGGFASRL